MSSLSIPSSFSIVSPSNFKHDNRHAIQVRAQSCRDGGRSSNRVDSNLGVLKERIELVKMKEKLERCCRSCDQYGWNYAATAGRSGYDSKMKRRDNGEISELFEIVSLVGATVGFTCLTGTLFLYIISIFVHNFP